MSLCPIQRAGNADLKYLRVNISHSKKQFRSHTGFPQTDCYHSQTTPGYVVAFIIAFLPENVNYSI